MSKIFSKYLNREIEVSLIETMENAKIVMLITHDSLCDVIHNQIPVEKGVRYDVVFNNRVYPSCICTITDKSGRRVQDCGSAKPETLNNKIAQDNDDNMAFNRAFDRAAIKFLNLPGKFFSNTEIIITDTVTESAKAKEEPVKNEKTEKAERKAVIVDEEKCKENIKPDNDYDDILITIGKYSRNPIKLSELIAKAEGESEGTGVKSWMKYVVENVHPKETEKLVQVEAFKAYLEK